MDKVKFGIIGIGNRGSGHCRLILAENSPEMELAAVCDIDPARIEWAKENLPDTVKIFTEAEDLIASPDVNAVIIAVPHYDHPKYVISCMKHGKHVICEKPAGVYTKQVVEANEETRKHPELVFAMMFNQRTNHLYRAMHEMAASGKYGQIKRVNWIITDWYRTQAYYNSGGWRATWAGEGGGVLMNQSPHQLDLLQWICGLPVKVRAFCHEGKWHDIEVDDDVTAYMEFANGATGVFVTSTGSAPGTNRFELEFEKAKVVCENDELSVYELEENERDFCFACPQGFAKPAGHYVKVETDGQNLQHIGVIRNFVAAVLHGEPLIASGRDGIYGLELANAMFLSSWLDKTVTVPVDREVYWEELQKRIATSKVKENVQAITGDNSDPFAN